MPLLAFNITGSQVTLVAGNPAPVLPPSLNPPERGKAVDVTKELGGLTDAEYASLESQRAGVVEYQWTGDEEFTVGALSPNVVTFAVDPHAPQHFTGGSDEIAVKGTIATNQPITGTNQSASTGMSLSATTPPDMASATTGLSVDAATATNQAATATNQTQRRVRHETYIDVEGPGIQKAVIVETAASVSPSAQPFHPRTLTVIFDAGWAGGDIEVRGTGVDGNPVMETFVSNPGGVRLGSEAFMLIDTPNGVINTVPAGGGGDSAFVETSTGLGVVLDSTESDPTFLKLTVDGADDTIAGSSGAFRTFVPGTPPNGSRDYEIWYSTEHTHVQDSHTHTQDSHAHGTTESPHGHNQVSHTHNLTDPGHNHTQDPHTHTQDSHSHDLA